MNPGVCFWCGGMIDDPFADDVCDDCQAEDEERQEEIEMEDALNGDEYDDDDIFEEV